VEEFGLGWVGLVGEISPFGARLRGPVIRVRLILKSDPRVVLVRGLSRFVTCKISKSRILYPVVRVMFW
jgi:hypothetical protein